MMFNKVFGACEIGPNEKISVFRVTLPYLNLLVKPRICSGFLDFFMNFERRNAFQNAEQYIFSRLKNEMPFKIHKIMFFTRLKNK